MRAGPDRVVRGANRSRSNACPEEETSWLVRVVCVSGRESRVSCRPQGPCGAPDGGYLPQQRPGGPRATTAQQQQQHQIPPCDIRVPPLPSSPPSHSRCCARLVCVCVFEARLTTRTLPQSRTLERKASTLIGGGLSLLLARAPSRSLGRRRCGTRHGWYVLRRDRCANLVVATELSLTRVSSVLPRWRVDAVGALLSPRHKR